MADDILPDPLTAMLERLKLTALRDRLDNLLDDASRREMSFRETLGYLLAAEIGHRDERRTRMATGIAKFPLRRAPSTASTSPPSPRSTPAKSATSPPAAGDRQRRRAAGARAAGRRQDPGIHGVAGFDATGKTMKRTASTR